MPGLAGIRDVRGRHPNALRLARRDVELQRSKAILSRLELLLLLLHLSWKRLNGAMHKRFRRLIGHVSVLSAHQIRQELTGRVGMLYKRSFRSKGRKLCLVLVRVAFDCGGIPCQRNADRAVWDNRFGLSFRCPSESACEWHR